MDKSNPRKILIVADVFPPAFAPRMGYLVKYLKELNWEADVICEDHAKDNNFNFLIGNTRIVKVKLINTDMPADLCGKAWYFFNLRKKYLSNKKPFIAAAVQQLKKEDYALVLVSTAWNLFVLYAASDISKLWKLPLIVDLRDIYEQKPSIKSESKNLISGFATWRYRLLDRQNIRHRNTIMAEAVAVTSVSHFDLKVLSEFNRKTSLIFNGFDPDLFYPRKLEQQKEFKIIYTGSAGNIPESLMHAPEQLFEAVYILKNDHKIQASDFRLQFYIPEREHYMIREVKYYADVSEFVDLFGYIESSKLPDVLNDAAITLILLYVSDQFRPQGIIPTKFYEYMAMERPVLCVNSDEGELEAAIIDANAGCPARNTGDIVSFIESKLEEWKTLGYTKSLVDHRILEKYSRKFQAKQFIDLFESIVTFNEN